MIARVIPKHGWRPAGLIAYLFGPGRHEEHSNPRLVATWDQAPSFHQPPKLPAVELDGEILEPGEFDFDLGPLAEVMQEWPRRIGLPLTNPPPIPMAAPGDVAGNQEVETWTRWLRTAGRRKPPPGAPDWVRLYRFDPKANQIVLKQGYVWHCPVRLHPDDPVLDDATWQTIAHRLMEATGIDQEGCRWIAVRHADDHIHLMATLVSETTGRRISPHNDYARLRKACQDLERELGLVLTAGIDTTASSRPSRAELGKSTRYGRAHPVRLELRRRVSQAAAGARSGAEFLSALSAQRLVVHLQRGTDGTIRGYAVGLPTDRTATGAQILYAGGKLASDLTWPKLQVRWATTPVGRATPLARTAAGHPTPAARHATIEAATEAVAQATAALRATRDDPTSRRADGDGIAHATGEVLASLAAVSEGRRPGTLHDAADLYDRCARAPGRTVPLDLGPIARELRNVSRQLAQLSVLSGRGQEKFATIALLLALAGLLAEIGAWQQMRGREHHAAAARRALDAIPTDARRSRTSRPTSAPPAHRTAAQGEGAVPETATRRRVPGSGPAPGGGSGPRPGR